MSRQRVLLVAYQCGPGMGSVSQIGWEWYARLSRECAVTLVTHVRNREALQQAQAPLTGGEIIYMDTEWFSGPLYRLARRLFPGREHAVFLLSSLDYFVFDFAAYWLLRRRIRRHAAHWDVLHRVTPVTLAAPTWLGRLRIPTVIGPLNSGLSDPPGFDDVTRRESTLLTRLRGLAGVLDALLGSTRHAARILTASRATRQAVAPRYQSLCRAMLENGVDLARFQVTPWPALPGGEQPLRVLFTGRLVAVKGVHLLLRAVASLRADGWPVRLDVVGDGPMRAEWMGLRDELGLGDSVAFHGAQPLEQVAAHMRACHVFCLPSVRESGGSVLLEAMASARPVIALDFGGPGEIVDAEVGALLPLHNPEQVVSDLVQTLRDVFQQPQQWQLRGRAGRARAEALYSWPAKITEARKLYGEVISERSFSCS